MAKPPSSTKSVRLYDSVWDGLKLEAEASGTTVNKLIARAVDHYDSPPDCRSPETAKQVARIKAKTIKRTTQARNIIETAERVVDGKVMTYMGAQMKSPSDAAAVIAETWKRPKPVHVDVPAFERKAFNPQPKTGKKK